MSLSIYFLHCVYFIPVFSNSNAKWIVSNVLNEDDIMNGVQYSKTLFNVLTNSWKDLHQLMAERDIQEGAVGDHRGPLSIRTRDSHVSILLYIQCVY